MSKSLIEKIKVEETRNNKVIRTEWRFWPTDASCVMSDGKLIGKCLRLLYYQWMQEEVTNPVNDFVKTLGKIGNFLEEDARKKYKKKGLLPEEVNKKQNRKCRIEIFKGGTLSGEVDIFLKDEDEKCGVEVKSYSNSTYKVVARPKDPHLLQTFLYLYFFEPKQDYFIIYYRPSMVSKYAEKDVYHRIDWVEMEGEIHPVIDGQVDKRISIKGIVDRFKEAKYYIENKILPKREYTKSSKDCNYCPYKTTCWVRDKDKEGEKLGESNEL